MICFKCGESGHSGYRCTNAICPFCLRDHPVHECDQLAPNKRTFTFCLRCGSTEHYLNQCEMPMAHRVARLQCFVCGEYGHLNCRALDAMEAMDHHNGRPRSGVNGPKRVQLCSNCGDTRHTVYFCKEMPMDNTMIAVGLCTAPHEPKICFKCLSPGHDARLCPLTIRQKRNRQQRDSKYSYRSTSNASSSSKVSASTAIMTSNSKRQLSPHHKKRKAQSHRDMQRMQKQWREESMQLIRQFGKKQKKIKKKRNGYQNKQKSMRKAKKRLDHGLKRLRRKGKSAVPSWNSGLDTMVNTGTSRAPSWNRHFDDI